MIHPNEPAFVILTESAIDSGLTKREYFAALAMQGLLANPAVDMLEITAKKAVKTADYLIKALNENPVNE